MFQGFYDLTSGILCQNRNLNVISNNMSNVSTPGYRSEKFMATTFREELLYRSGNKDKSNAAAIGTSAMIRAADETVTSFTEGSYEETDQVLDFALSKPGFFSIQTGQGTVYTRNGSFIVDDEGYLALPSIGRVLGTNGPIRLGTDKISVDNVGNIYSEDGQTLFGTLSIVDFQDYATQLNKTTGGVFTANAAGTPVENAVMWKMLETSNVDSIKEMTSMMSAQRNLQSTAQVLKMYDGLMDKAVKIGLMQ